MPTPNKEKLRHLPSYAVSVRQGGSCLRAHTTIQLCLLAVATLVVLSATYSSFFSSDQEKDPPHGLPDANVQLSSLPQKSSLTEALQGFKTTPKEQRNPYVPLPIPKYPQGNRSILLPQEPLCNAAYQTTPWVTNMPADAPRPKFIHINTSCEGAVERATDIRPSTRLSPKEVETKITLALFYYQDMQLLSRQVQTWMSWPLWIRHFYEFIILDDGSQVGLRAMDFLHRHAGRIKARINLTVYEVEQDLKFNMGGVRNLAHAVAETDHVLALDTDVYTNATVAEYLLRVLHETQHQDKTEQLLAETDAAVEHQDEEDNSETNSEKRSMQTPPKLRIWKFLWQLMPDKVKMEPHPAVMLSHKQAYWAVGGCDEDLVGNYGQTDILLLWKADRDKALTVVSLADDMKDKQIFVQKWWKREKKACHPTLPCPVNLPKAERPPIKRVLKPNMDIFQDKRQKKANFSTSFLRFGWHKVADF